MQDRPPEKFVPGGRSGRLPRRGLKRLARGKEGVVRRVGERGGKADPDEMRVDPDHTRRDLAPLGLDGDVNAPSQRPSVKPDHGAHATEFDDGAPEPSPPPRDRDRQQARPSPRAAVADAPQPVEQAKRRGKDKKEYREEAIDPGLRIGTPGILAKAVGRRETPAPPSAPHEAAGPEVADAPFCAEPGQRPATGHAAPEWPPA